MADLAMGSFLCFFLLPFLLMPAAVDPVRQVGRRGGYEAIAQGPREGPDGQAGYDVVIDGSHSVAPFLSQFFPKAPNFARASASSLPHFPAWAFTFFISRVTFGWYFQ